METVVFSQWVLYFVMYSFVGWVCEVVYCSIPAKKIVKRGFLAGPYCPIYGFGAIFLIILLQPIAVGLKSLPIVFILSAIIASILEYFTSWLMEKLFHMRWWDYSKKKFNINGRVCLLNSTLFGIIGTVLLYIVQPRAENIMLSIPTDIQIGVSSLLIGIMLIDAVTSFNGAYQLVDKMKEVQHTIELLSKKQKEYEWLDLSDISGSIANLEMHAKDENDSETLNLALKLQQTIERDFGGKRLLSTFKELKPTHLKFEQHLNILKQDFSQKKTTFFEAVKKQKEKTTLEKDKAKDTSDKKGVSKKDEVVSFASGFNFYKFFWIFFIGCIAGYIFETIYCLVTRGFIESRQGLIYGPFSQVYGAAAVILVFLLHKLAEKKGYWLFLASAVIGGVFETVCSLIQEYFFNSVSWNYKGYNFSILNGRTNLLYMVFWGVLGVALMKVIYPRLSRFVEKIPNKQGVVISNILIVFMVLNMAISALAVARWSKRVKNIPAENVFTEFLDNHYPDDFMKNIYPNLTFEENSKK